MTMAFFFGYGSLVNRRTHAYAPVFNASLTGWRRAWRATDARPAAFLTVVRDPSATIQGLIAPVPGADWAALDAREAAYDRHDATDQVTHAAQVGSIAVYAISPDRMVAGGASHPILLSYLDVVIQGFLAEHGSDGPEEFFATTTGWDTPVLNDRAAPIYPRAQPLSASERALVDHGLARVGARIMTG